MYRKYKITRHIYKVQVIFKGVGMQCHLLIVCEGTKLTVLLQCQMIIIVILTRLMNAFVIII